MEIAIINTDPLVNKGLIHFILKLFPDARVEIFQDTIQFRSEGWPAGVIFLNPLLMEQPHAVSLERLYSEYGNSRIVGLCQQKPGENLLPYFSSIIRYDSSEKEIISSLEKLRETAPGSKEISLARELISEREKEVLRGVALGMTNKEISDMLFISSHTVITHRKNITAKLGIKTIAGLAVYAVLNGIIDPEEMEEH